MSTRTTLFLACLAAWPALGSPAAAQPAPIAARQESFIGSHHGTLKVGNDGVTFVANNPKDNQQWTFEEIRQLRIETPQRIVVETYHSRGWRGFGHSQTHTIRTTAPVAAEWVAFVLSRTTRSVVTSVIPTRTTPAEFSVEVNHEGTDTGGRLAIYADGLAFETPRDGFARFWRFADLDAVLLQDRFRLLVGAYEGSREEIRPFLFTLKQDLPAGFQDELWRAVNGRYQSP